MTAASRMMGYREIGIDVPIGDPRKRGSFQPLIERIEQGLGRPGMSSAAFRAGALVRALRKGSHLSQADLAERLRMKQPRISQIEAGIGNQGPSWEVMKRIAEACGAVIHVRQGDTDFELLGDMAELETAAVAGD